MKQKLNRSDPLSDLNDHHDRLHFRKNDGKLIEMIQEAKRKSALKILRYTDTSLFKKVGNASFFYPAEIDDYLRELFENVRKRCLYIDHKLVLSGSYTKDNNDVVRSFIRFVETCFNDARYKDIFIYRYIYRYDPLMIMSKMNISSAIDYYDLLKSTNRYIEQLLYVRYEEDQ